MRNFVTRHLFGVLALALGLGACSDDPTGLRPGDAKRDINISTGMLEIELRYEGQPVAALGVGNACEFGYTIDGQWGSSWNACTGSVIKVEVKSGKRAVQMQVPYAARQQTGEIYHFSRPVGSADSVDVIAGATTRHVVELSSSLGLAKGKLSINGSVPTTGAYGVCAMGWNREQCGAVAEDGSFAVLGLPGQQGETPLALVVSRNFSTVSGLVEPGFEVGKTVDLGVVAATPGSLLIRPTFKGTPLGELGIHGHSICNVGLQVQGRWVNRLCPPEPEIRAEGLMSGDRPMMLQFSYGSGSTWKTDTLASDTIVIAGGQTTTWAPDFALKTALVKGQVQVGGAAPSQPYFVCLGDGGCAQTGAEGRFSILAPPGTGKVIIRSPSYAVAKEVSYTATAGETIDLGVLTAEVAHLKVRVLFAGSPLPAAAVAHACNFVLFINGSQAGGWLCNPSNPGVIELQGIGAGTHALQLRYPYEYTVAETSVEIAAGESKTVTLEIGGKLGLVSATVKVNGSTSYANYTYAITRSPKWEWDGTTSRMVEPGLWVPVPTGGELQFFDHAGPRLSEVRTQANYNLLSEFGYSVVAGQTTIVGTTEGGASGKTETGDSVVVKPVDSSTGGSTVELTFGEVTSGGQTTVSSTTTEPISNPLPDTVSAGSNPVFYNIETSATFTGTVRLCFNYPDDHGFSDESAIRLFHGKDDGTWEDITVDGYPIVELNLICGETDSFSPFVLVQPKNRRPVVGALQGATILEGETYAERGSFSDPDGNDSWTATADYGDGSAAGALTLGGDKNFDLSHKYVAAGSYTVKVTVKDSRNATGSRTTTVVVQTPVQGIEALEALVKGEDGGSLFSANRLRPAGAQWSSNASGTQTSLLAKLQAAREQLNRGSKGAAVNQLKAFINEVDAMHRSGRMAGTLHARLVSGAERVIKSIG